LNIDWKTVSPYAYAVAGGGVLAFIFSFLPYYTLNVLGFGFGGVSAWHGFFGWFGALLLLAAAAAIVLKTLKIFDHAILPLGTLIASGAGLLCVLLALFVAPVNTYGVASFGHHIGYWLSLIMALASTAGALMLYMQTQKAAKPAVPAFPGYPGYIAQPPMPGGPQPYAPPVGQYEPPAGQYEPPAGPYEPPAAPPQSPYVPPESPFAPPAPQA